MVAYAQENPAQSLESDRLLDNHEELVGQRNALKGNLFRNRELIADSKLISYASHEIVEFIQNDVHEQLQQYLEQQRKIDLIVEASAGQNQQTAGLTEQLLATMLGDPIGQTYGENSTVKVYSLEDAGYRGYMAKVRLHNPNAIKMMLASDKLKSSGETTSQAGKRSGAILAVNAGGFNSKSGKLSPIGITVINGEILTYYDSGISFIGFNQNGKLVGGTVTSKEQIKEMNVRNGASFLPTLLKDGKKSSIPSGWANAKHPRTLIGHFENGDLFFMVIDGRRKGWSNGVTLEDAQDKLLEFNIRDAYNLDGGGSSTFYYDGKVLNKPSGGQERKVVTNIVVLP